MSFETSGVKYPCLNMLELGLLLNSQNEYLCFFILCLHILYSSFVGTYLLWLSVTFQLLHENIFIEGQEFLFCYKLWPELLIESHFDPFCEFHCFQQTKTFYQACDPVIGRKYDILSREVRVANNSDL